MSVVALLDIGSSALKWRIVTNGIIASQHYWYHHGNNTALTDKIKSVTSAATQIFGMATMHDTIAHDTIAHDTIAMSGTAITFISPSKYSNIPTSYHTASEYGIDRQIALHASSVFYPHAKEVLLVGCGTITTIDLIQSAIHQGGFLLPSTHSQQQLLRKQLGRKITDNHNIEAAPEPAKNTEIAILAGALFSQVAVIAKLHERFKAPPLIILFGTKADALSKQLAHCHLVRPWLLFDTMQHVELPQLELPQ